MFRRLFGREFQTAEAAKLNERSPANLKFTRSILSSFSDDERRDRDG